MIIGQSAALSSATQHVISQIVDCGALIIGSHTVMKGRVENGERSVLALGSTFKLPILLKILLGCFYIKYNCKSVITNSFKNWIPREVAI